MNEVLMTFSGFGSYCEDTYDYDEYIATQCVFDKLEGGITAFQVWRVWCFVVDKAFHIIQLHKTICISLTTVRGVQLSIGGCLFTQCDEMS